MGLKNLSNSYKKIKPAIIAIASRLSTNSVFPSIIGTGFCVREDGIIFTNRHVIQAIKKLPRRKDSPDEWPAIVLYFNYDPHKGMGIVKLEIDGVALIEQNPLPKKYYGTENLDVGIITLKDVKGLPVVALKKDVISEGDQIVVAGFPMGSRTLCAPGWLHQIGPTLQTGIVSALLPMPCDNPHGFLLDMMVQGGSSGSPIFLPGTGKVVGIIYAGLLETYKFTGEQGALLYKVPTTLTLAIPSHFLFNVLSKIDTTKEIQINNKNKIDLSEYMQKLETRKMRPKTGTPMDPYLGEVIRDS